MRTPTVHFRASKFPACREAGRSFVEPLESRLLFSQLNYLVTTTADSGGGSLLDAINDANAKPGYRNIIDFAIPGSGVHTISPASQFPLLKTHIEIHGTTDANGNPLIEINGQNAGANSSGLIFNRSTPGDNSAAIVSGLVINRFAHNGINIAGQGDIEVIGCRIGVDPTGLIARPNGLDGLRIYSPSNFVGLPYHGSAYTNIISGNGEDGISIFGGAAGGNVIQNNFIGLAADGNHALGNARDGIWIDTAGTLIGGADPIEGNFISGNRQHGIETSTNYGGPKAAGPSQIFGNEIGTNYAGSAAVPNADCGIFITAGASTQIGDSRVGTRNIISGNGAAGISIANVKATVVNAYVGTDITGAKPLGNTYNGIALGYDSGSTFTSCVVSGNSSNTGGYGGFAIANSSSIKITNCPIGTNAAMTGPIANNGYGIAVLASNHVDIENNTIAYNTSSIKPCAGVYVNQAALIVLIEENSIYSNDGLGIQLGSSQSPLANDLGDSDSGPNGLQNYAVLTSAVSDSERNLVKGAFNGKADTLFTLDLYSSPSADASGYGQGKTFLTDITFYTDASGNATFSGGIPMTPKGQFITCTVTDRTTGTSEFSKAIKQA